MCVGARLCLALSSASSRFSQLIESARVFFLSLVTLFNTACELTFFTRHTLASYSGSVRSVLLVFLVSACVLSVLRVRVRLSARSLLL